MNTLAETIAYGSSLRSVPVEVTLERAAKLGAELGITRVTDTTRLDRVGIPVFAAIRPGAMPGSLCVHAGKGITPKEACASAWMEAIEFALAQPGASPIPTLMATAREVLDGRTRPDAILDLCPQENVSIPLDAPLLCVEAEEMVTDQTVLLPAELGFYPAPPEDTTVYFGANTNGLASGNSLLEATVHALAEVIERDIRSFYLVGNTSVLVEEETFPPVAAHLACLIRQAGLRLFVRYQPNLFQLPYFEVAIHDPEHPTPLFLHGGSACHPHAKIALVRAICEAAQSRLTAIHGGRDDLASIYDDMEAMDEAEKALHIESVLFQVESRERVMDYQAIMDFSASTKDLSACLDTLVNVLLRNGFPRICRLVYTQPEQELQVVKIIVPGLEDMEYPIPRVGKRLDAYWV